jgi:hypothetical protein
MVYQHSQAGTSGAMRCSCTKSSSAKRMAMLAGVFRRTQCRPSAGCPAPIRRIKACQFPHLELFSRLRIDDEGGSHARFRATRPRSSDCRKRAMKTPIALALLAILAFALSPAAAAERACRPSLSNAYHCPDTSAPEKRSTLPTTTSGRACRPSLSNLWTCPDTSQPRPTSASTDRPCRPSLSNGYSCPGSSTEGRGSAPPRSERTGPAGADQYTAETLARAHCPTDTVIWANTRSGVYHFRNTSSYGNTKAGAYMCEQAALAQGIRAAKNEKHP